MGQAPLPGAALELPGDGGHEAGVVVGDHEPHPGQPARPEAGEEGAPRLLALGVHRVGAEEVLAAVRAEPYRRDHAAGRDRRAVAAAHVGGVEPQVAAGGAGQVARPRLLHVRVEAVAQPRHLRARQRRYPEPLGDPLHLARGDAADVHLLHDGGDREVDPRPPLDHPLGVVGALPGLGDLELHVPHGGLGGPRPVAVPAVGPRAGALVAARPARLLGLPVHHRVHHGREHPARELPRVSALVPGGHRRRGLLRRQPEYTLVLGHRPSFLSKTLSNDGF